jgi:hypothetical protein
VTISSGGLLELQGGATAGPDIAASGGITGAVTFAGGGTLKLDGTGKYNFLVAGFGVPDALDFPLSISHRRQSSIRATQPPAP